jgi:hypothetical protein
LKTVADAFGVVEAVNAKEDFAALKLLAQRVEFSLGLIEFCEISEFVRVD